MMYVTIDNIINTTHNNNMQLPTSQQTFGFLFASSC